jgi:hypothetical protein
MPLLRFGPRLINTDTITFAVPLDADGQLPNMPGDWPRSPGGFMVLFTGGNPLILSAKQAPKFLEAIAGLGSVPDLGDMPE